MNRTDARSWFEGMKARLVVAAALFSGAGLCAASIIGLGWREAERSGECWQLTFEHNGRYHCGTRISYRSGLVRERYCLTNARLVIDLRKRKKLPEKPKRVGYYSALRREPTLPRYCVSRRIVRRVPESHRRWVWVGRGAAATGALAALSALVMIPFLFRRQAPSPRLGRTLWRCAVLFAASFAALGAWFHYVPPFPGVIEPGDVPSGLWMCWAGALLCAVGAVLFWHTIRETKQADDESPV